MLMVFSDCVLPAQQRKVATDSDDDETDEGKNESEGDPGRYGLTKSTVTLSGLLNAIDGVASQVSIVSVTDSADLSRLRRVHLLWFILADAVAIGRLGLACFFKPSGKT